MVSVEQALLTTQDESERAELLTLKDSLIELIALTQYSEEENKDEIDKEMQNFMREIKEIDQEDELQKVKVHNFGFFELTIVIDIINFRKDMKRWLVTSAALLTYIHGVL